MSESLVVLLDSDTKKLDAGLKKTDKHLKSLDKQTKKNDKSFIEFESSTKKVDVGLVALTTAGLALATALTAMIVATAKSQQELSILSRQAKLSTDDFEALSFATKQYGINAEQIADISKDLSDKLGEFGKAGTGAFQDFADVTGMTKEQAQELAREFENLSGPQVIGEMVSRMEEAGASSNEMTFALESMGNDLSRLTPLFVNNSKELKSLTKTYSDATKQMKLTSAEIDELQGAATAFDLMTDSLSKAGSLISASIAPLLNEFFGGVIDVVPEATQTIVDFINSFKDAESIKSIDSMNRLIEDQKALVQELRMEQNKIGTSFASMFDSEQSLIAQKEQINLEIEKEVQRIDELIAARDKLTEQELEAAANRPSSGGITATFNPEAIAEENQAKEDLEQEHQDNLAAIKDQAAADDKAREQGLADLFSDVASDDIKDTDKANKSKATSDQIYVNSALDGVDAMFEGNKAVDAGLVVSKTALGIMNQFSGGDPLTAFARAAAVGAAGAIQLANVLGATKGGGSVSSTTSAPPASSTQEQPEELSTIDVDSQDSSGQGGAITIKFEGNGDDITEAIAKNIKVMEFNGTL